MVITPANPDDAHLATIAVAAFATPQAFLSPCVMVVPPLVMPTNPAFHSVRVCPPPMAFRTAFKGLFIVIPAVTRVACGAPVVLSRMVPIFIPPLATWLPVVVRTPDTKALCCTVRPVPAAVIVALTTVRAPLPLAVMLASATALAMIWSRNDSTLLRKVALMPGGVTLLVNGPELPYTAKLIIHLLSLL